MRRFCVFAHYKFSLAVWAVWLIPYFGPMFSVMGNREVCTMTQPVERIWRIRAYIYQHFADTARPPTVDQVADHFGLARPEADALFRELDRLHAFFLEPGTLDIRIANPFSAVPTDFRVHAQGQDYWANCAWDALGIPAALHADATIDAVCAQSGERLSLAVQGGRLVPTDAVAHFLVPFGEWYEDMVFT